MSNAKLTVSVTRRLPAPVENRMRELFDLRLRNNDHPMRREELQAAMANCDVLVPTITDIIDESLLAQAGERLKLIANFGAGFDNIDVEAARARDILISNTPDVVTEDTADMVIGLILAVSRRLREGINMMESDSWDGWSPTAMMGNRVGGKMLGILGMGRIGTAVARRAAAFGMEIHYHNRRQVHAEVESELKATFWDSLDQMISRVDIVTVNCPHTPSTYHLLNARRLRLMKPTAILVNTSRGDVLDQNALIRMLLKKQIAGAGLDVFARDTNMDLPPRGLDNVVLLPHMGSATVEGRIEMGERVLINIKTFADGHRPPDLVVPGSL
ncbi:MAG: D-glycerate dehydrogenase [Rhodobacteraceae bacterium]|nr:D-glycerate dehydrogenase [Paracoccaceae bacterium]MCY4197869.1 D-glycerate dehydrogenase [Paracoccaceae bacterium]MCY4325968.1 D-glycerate dehydrogenase [Paracoccaceae bacterium]